MRLLQRLHPNTRRAARLSFAAVAFFVALAVVAFWRGAVAERPDLVVLGIAIFCLTFAISVVLPGVFLYLSNRAQNRDELEEAMDDYVGEQLYYHNSHGRFAEDPLDLGLSSELYKYALTRLSADGRSGTLRVEGHGLGVDREINA